jgi:hypothetical protein
LSLIAFRTSSALFMSCPQLNLEIPTPADR